MEMGEIYREFYGRYPDRDLECEAADELMLRLAALRDDNIITEEFLVEMQNLLGDVMEETEKAAFAAGYQAKEEGIG